jgi:hypothetical protein
VILGKRALLWLEWFEFKPAQAGGENNMKKVFAITVITVLALLITSAVVFAKPGNGPNIIKCDQFIAVYLNEGENAHWRGTLTNCELDGATVHYYGIDTNRNSKGMSSHFAENFVIYPNGDDYPEVFIKGSEEGLWNMNTFKFRSEGRVTEANGPWSYLVGYKFHEMGVTDNPFLVWDVLKGPSTMFLAGP